MSGAGHKVGRGTGAKREEEDGESGGSEKITSIAGDAAEAWNEKQGEVMEGDRGGKTLIHKMWIKNMFFFLNPSLSQNQGGEVKKSTLYIQTSNFFLEKSWWKGKATSYRDLPAVTLVPLGSHDI